MDPIDLELQIDFPCLFSDISRHCGPDPWSLRCVSLWAALIKSDPGPDLWFTFWLDLRPAVSPWPFVALGYCLWVWPAQLAWAVWGLGSSWWGPCPAIPLLSSGPGFPSLRKQPALTIPWKIYPKHCDYYCFSKWPCSDYRKFKISMLHFKDPLKGHDSISFLHKVLYRLYCGLF